MTALTIDRFEQWLQQYGVAWETGDPEAVTILFSETAAYHETPFDEPLVGREAIRAYWHEGAESSQRNVRFHYAAPLVAGQQGLARWSATFERLPSGNRVELDGFLTADFDEVGQCERFREWWHRRETPRE